MRKQGIIFLTMLGLFLAQNADAQIERGPKFYSDFKPVIGGWSEYQMTSKGEPPMKMKVAIVGKEGEAYWYESVFEGGKEGRVVTKMLVSGNPGESNNVKRMIVKVGDEPAMEMSPQMMGQPGQPGKEKIIEKGTETIKVPAGTFTTRRVQIQEGTLLVDNWIHKDVPPHGLVKSQSKDGEMVLLRHGTGATSMITETPQKFEMPALPQMEERPERRPRKR